MADRKEDQDAKAGEQAPAEMDCLDIPMVNRMLPDVRDDEGDYLPLPPIICRGIGKWREEKPSLWSRLRRWVSRR